MAYDINKSDGTLLVSVADGTLDSTTSIKLVGKNYVGYGEQIAEDFVHMLEHFAKATEPANPLKGQLWFDTSVNKVKVRDNNNNWKELGQLVSSNTAPSSSVATTGDFWFDTANKLLYIWNGTAWQPVGVGNDNTYVGYVEITDTVAVVHQCLVDVHNKKFMTISNGDAPPSASSSRKTSRMLCKDASSSAFSANSPSAAAVNFCRIHNAGWMKPASSAKYLS